MLDSTTSPLFRVDRERLANCLVEVKGLLDGHYRELARNQDLFALRPNFDLYLKLEEADGYRFYVARSMDYGANHYRQIVGYAGYIISRNMHYLDCVLATSDLFYVVPEFRDPTPGWLRPVTSALKAAGLMPRRCGVGRSLFEMAETDLSAAGVHVMHTTFKIASPAPGFVLRRLGHLPIEYGYAKVIGRPNT